MNAIKSNEFIILRLPSIEKNIVFINITFGITEYIFKDDRFLTKYLKDKYPDKFDKKVYDLFREKCLKIENNDISFTIDEFILFAKLVDFVSKCFIGEPNKKLEQVITEDFINEIDFNYNVYRDIYLRTSSSFFEEFRKTCVNKKLLKKIEIVLDWKIEI